MTLEAQTKGEHRLWLNGIINFCPKASISGVTTTDLSSIEGRLGAKETAKSVNDDPEPVNNITKSPRAKKKSREKREDKQREDHRKTHNPISGEPTTARLYGHIKGEDKLTAEHKVH